MDEFGSDFITITDEDGVEYELEVLSTVEYQGALYYALVPAEAQDDEAPDLEVSILKSVTENGEALLEAVQDEAVLEAVYHLFEEQFYDEAELEES